MNGDSQHRPIRYFDAETVSSGASLAMALSEFADVVLTQDGTPIAVLVSHEAYTASKDKAQASTTSSGRGTHELGS